MEEFSKAEPELVVLDVKTPGLDGLEVLQRLRQISEVPVVLLSGKGTEMDEAISLRMGADDYVVNPSLSGFSRSAFPRICAGRRRGGQSRSNRQFRPSARSRLKRPKYPASSTPNSQWIRAASPCCGATKSCP